MHGGQAAGGDQTLKDQRIKAFQDGLSKELVAALEGIMARIRARVEHPFMS